MDLAEKLTETIAVKLSQTQVRHIRGVAESEGLEPSSWCRQVIDQALQQAEAKYRSLHTVFADAGSEAKVNKGQQG